MGPHRDNCCGPLERSQQYLQRQSLRQGQLQALLQRPALTELQTLALTARQTPALTALQRLARAQRLAQSLRIPQTLGQTRTLVWSLHQSLRAPLQRPRRVRTEQPAEMRQRQSSKPAAVQLLEHLSQIRPLQQKRISSGIHPEGLLVTCQSHPEQAHTALPLLICPTPPLSTGEC